MRRAIPVILATMVGIVLVLSFHTTAEPTTITSPKSTTPSPSTSVPAAAGGSAPPSTAGTLRTLTGTLEENRYGPVQVRITVRGTQMVDIVALQLPSDRAHSQRLSAEAGPILRTEALQAQSAKIHVVSGATFTSESYAQSLQSVLDQAGIGG
jgi:uncharacterized protein with FMN-binding domain